MELALFGGLAVRIAGREVELSPRERGLLSMLALASGSIVTSDILIYHLWPHDLPRNPKGSLQELVLRLRRAIGDLERKAVQRTGTGYRLEIEPNSLDTAVFHRLALAGIALVRAEPDLAASFLSDALDLADGDLPDLAPDTFLSPRVDELRELKARAKSTLELLRIPPAALPPARYSRRLGLGLLITELPALVTAELAAEIASCGGVLEQLSDGVLRSAFSGVSAALRAADKASRLLSPVQGISGGAVAHLADVEGDGEWTPVFKLAAAAPDGTIVAPPAIHRVAGMAGNRIPTHRLSEDLWQIGEAAAVRPDDAIAHESPFTGRGRDVADLAALIPKARLVTLRGPGGIGKTRLATELTRLVETRFDEVHRVNLAEASAFGNPLVFVANRLGSISQPDRPILETLLDRLAQSKGLMLLDNCEMFAEELRPFCEAAAARCPDLRILATSRSSLRAVHEIVYELEGLQPQDAAELLIALAFPGATGARPGAYDPVVTRLCERLDGIPLAIECAAPLAITMGSLAALEATLDQLPDGAMMPLLDAALGGKGRHRSIELALVLSHRALSDEEALFFERLSCLRSVFATEDAAVAAPDTKGRMLSDSLSRLSEGSLLRSEGPDRWRMLEPIRQFAATLLLRRGDQEEQGGRHGRYFVDFAARVAAELRSPSEAHWFERVSEAYPNVLAALNWGVRTRQADHALVLTSSLHWYWAALGMNIEGASSLEQALALAGGHPTNRAKALCALAHLSWWAGDPVRSESANAEALRLVTDRSASDAELTILEAWARTGLAAAKLWGGGNRSLLEHHLQVAETLFSQVNDDAGLGIALGTHGAMAWHYGDDETHLEKSLASLAAAERAGHQAFAGQMLRDAGLAMAKLGRSDEGRELVNKGLDLAKTLGDAGGLPMGYGFLGLLEVYAGRPVEAKEAFLQSLEHNRRPAQIWSGILAVAFAVENATVRPADGLALFAFVERCSKETGIGLAPAERRRFHKAALGLRDQLNPGVLSLAEELGGELTLAEAMEIALRLLKTI
ncbi:MAG: winged helix-turn-helix domain-containing protein [Actinomycetota bacterium]